MGERNERREKGKSERGREREREAQTERERESLPFRSLSPCLRAPGRALAIHPSCRGASPALAPISLPMDCVSHGPSSTLAHTLRAARVGACECDFKHECFNRCATRFVKPRLTLVACLRARWIALRGADAMVKPVCLPSLRGAAVAPRLPFKIRGLPPLLTLRGLPPLLKNKRFGTPGTV